MDLWLLQNPSVLQKLIEVDFSTHPWILGDEES